MLSVGTGISITQNRSSPNQSRGTGVPVGVPAGIPPGISNRSLPAPLSCRVILALRNPPISILKLLPRDPANPPNLGSSGPRNLNPSASLSKRIGPSADPALRGGAVEPASESSPVRTPVRPIRGQRSGRPTTWTRGSTTRSSNQACTRASTSWATFGTSWRRLREPIRERTERSRR